MTNNINKTMSVIAEFGFYSGCTCSRVRKQIYKYYLGYQDNPGEDWVNLGYVGVDTTPIEVLKRLNKGIIRYLNEEIEESPNNYYVIHKRRKTRETYAYSLFSEAIDGSTILLDRIEVPTSEDF